MEDLAEGESAIVLLVSDFVDLKGKPVVQELDHPNTYPEKLIERVKEFGVFALAIPGRGER